MSLDRRSFLQTAAAASAIAGIGGWSPHPAYGAPWVEVLRKLQPILVGALDVGTSLAGAGPFGPLVAGIGSVILTEVFDAASNKSPKAIDNTAANWKKELAAYVDTKFAEAERTRVANNLYGQIHYLKTTYKSHQLAKMKSERVEQINQLSKETRKFLSDILLKNSESDLKKVSTDLMALGEDGLPGFSVCAGMVLMNERQLAMLDDPATSSHLDVYEAYLKDYSKHLDEMMGVAFAKSDPATADAAKQACIKIKQLWADSGTNLRDLVQGKLPGNRWTLYYDAANTELMPRLTMQYRWWSSDRAGILKHFPKWKSSDGLQQIHVSTTFQEYRYKGRVDFAEVVVVRGLNNPGGFWQGNYVYPRNKTTRDTFFERDMSRFGGNGPDGSTDHGFNYDGPFQMTFHNPNISGKKRVFYPIA